MVADEQTLLRERLAQAEERRARARAAADTAGQIAAAMECGQLHFELRDLEPALRLFSEATSLAEKSGAHDELLPELYGMTGRTHQRMKHWGDVLPWYRRAAEAAAARGLVAEQLRWLGKEASTLFDMKEPVKGRALLEKSIELGRALHAAGQPVAEELSDQLQLMAGAVDEQGAENAQALWQEAARLLEGLPASRARFQAAASYAGYLAVHDQHWLAETYLAEALEMAQQVGAGEQDRAQLAQRLAGLLRARNEPEQAGDHLSRILPSFANPHERHELQTAAVDAYQEARSWEKMKAGCEALQDMRRDRPPGWRHDVTMRYAIACMGLKDMDGALAALQRGMEIARLWGSPKAIADTLGELVIAHVERGNYRQGARLAERLWLDGKRSSLAARTYVRALIGLGDLDRAVQVVAEFRAAPDTSAADQEPASKSGDEEEKREAARRGKEQVAAYLDALLADAGRGDPLKAWYAFAAAARRSGPLATEALTHLIALHPQGSAERLEAARQRLRLIDRARSRVNDVVSDDSWRAAVERAPDFPEYLDTFLETAIAGAEHGQAVYELERFRAQALVNLLAERRALWSMGEVRGGWFKTNATLRYQRERYRLAGLTARGAAWRACRTAAENVERARDQALVAEGVIHVAPADQTLHFPQDLDQLLGEQTLGEGELIVCAHALADRVALWALDRERRVVHGAIPGLGAADVERLGRTVRALGVEHSNVDVDALLEELERRLAAPLVAWLARFAARHVFLAAGTAMFTLPLDCCPSTLGVEISMLPTSAALGYTRAPRRPLPEHLFLVRQEERDRWSSEAMAARRGQVLVVVDPTRELEFAALEAAMVTSENGARTVRIVDEASIESETMARSCEEVEVLHVIGHGTFDDRSPYRSGMYLGPRNDPASLWTNAEIFSDVNAPAARLAVLSGCETGQTKPNLVSEEVSLPSALIASGYACVIGSRWAVDDLSTSLLMGHFYERWCAGGTSACAALSASQSWLRGLGRDEAVRRLRALEPRVKDLLPGWTDARAKSTRDAIDRLAHEAELPFEDPYYWAPFFVAGDGTITSDGKDRRAPTPGGRGPARPERKEGAA